MTYLITGATGYIGSMLVERLTSSTEQNVIYALVRDYDKAKNMLGRKVNILRADLSNDSWYRLLEKENIDYLIHCASVTSSYDMKNKPVEVVESIVNTTQNILNFAKNKKIKSIVYLSSMEVYGNIDNIGEERSYEDNASEGKVEILAARSSYPMGKRMAENICYSYFIEYGVPVKIVRLAQTFGRGIKGNEKKVFAQFFKAAMCGEDIVLHTKGDSVGNYCGIDDALEGILTVLYRGTSGEVYNVVNEENTMTILEMAKVVSKVVSGGKSNIVFDIPEDNVYGYANKTGLRLSAKKLRDLGWVPRQTIADMYTDMRDKR